MVQNLPRTLANLGECQIDSHCNTSITRNEGGPEIDEGEQTRIDCQRVHKVLSRVSNKNLETLKTLEIDKALCKHTIITNNIYHSGYQPTVY